MSSSYRSNCFDASALVKVYATEPGSDLVRDYFYHRAASRYTTPFCFYEALNILKGKWRYRGQLTEGEYRKASFELVAWFGASNRFIKDVELTAPETLGAVQDIATRHALDLSDAFQIHSVKSGWFSSLINQSKTLLVTADRELAQAARAEGVLAWDVLSEAEP